MKARHIIGLVSYYKKFFPIFSNTIRSLNKVTRENIPFKWTDQCQRSLEYIKQVITTKPILIYPNPNKQYYLFMVSSKHSWSGNFVQYSEQAKDDGTKIKCHTQLLIKVEHSKALKRIVALSLKRLMPFTSLFEKWYFTSKKHM